MEYGRTATSKLEQQSRKAAISVASVIVENACKLMVEAREKAEEIDSAEILSNECMVTTLLPLVLAHISPLATSDPRVRNPRANNYIHVYLIQCVKDDDKKIVT